MATRTYTATHRKLYENGHHMVTVGPDGDGLGLVAIQFTPHCTTGGISTMTYETARELAAVLLKAADEAEAEAKE
jgi:hypothetical protein